MVHRTDELNADVDAVSIRIDTQLALCCLKTPCMW